MRIGVSITDAASSDPIFGASVAVYDGASTFVAGGDTEATGIVYFDLSGTSPEFGGTPYELRLYKDGVTFEGPYTIYIIEPDGTSLFEFTGVTEYKFGIPEDPYVCRCVGRFMNYSHGPMQNLLIRITTDVDLSKKMPKLMNSNFIAPEAMSFHTDSDGYVVMDLTRGGEYFLTVVGEDDQLWSFKVPDKASADLIGLIQVRPVSVTYETETVTVTTGSQTSVSAPVTWTDLIDRPGSVSNYVQFLSSDETIASALYSNGSLCVVGLAPGSCTVTAQAIPDTFPRSVPATAITAPVLHVSVT